jgi:hypothetical protein
MIGPTWEDEVVKRAAAALTVWSDDKFFSRRAISLSY